MTKKAAARRKRKTADAGRDGRPGESIERSGRIAVPRREVIEKGKPGLVIRDSFTMPLADYELIGALKKRCLGLGIAIKKSELLRAGLATLQRQSDASLAEVVAAVESVKTGRPPGRKKMTKTTRAKDRKQ
jgi:hypothetical protein